MKHGFFIGLGGCGMAGLAKIYREKNQAISGSDLADSPTLEGLRKLGIQVHLGHEADNLDDSVDYLVLSSAIPKDNPEYLRAKEMGIPVYHRSELLAQLTKEQKPLNVAGSHGKTTTSSMLSSILYQLGLKPTCVVGGEMELLGGNGLFGQGPYMVAEADESDASFLKLNSYLSILTNLEDDHLDYYGSQEKLNQAFYDFASQTDPKGAVLLGIDCPPLKDMAQKLRAERAERVEGAAVKTFGLEAGADYQAVNLRYENKRQAFTVLFQGQSLGRFSIYMPGKHNVKNALAAFAAAHIIGQEPQKIGKALAAYAGVGRRYQLKGRVAGIDIVDDYAHHPTEISALIKGAKEAGYGRVLALFQPHRYSRSQLFLKDFASALAQADLAFVSDIYSAGEAPLPAINAPAMVEGGPSHVGYGGDLVSAANMVLDKAQEDDLILTIGAGDVTQLGPLILANLEARQACFFRPRIEELAAYNSWHLASRAAAFYEIKTKAELMEVTASLPSFYLLGRGSNVFLDKASYRQAIIHLGPSFSKVKVRGKSLWAQAGISLTKLSQIAKEHGLSGLEPLKYIPASLGGAIYMNAGVPGLSILSLVSQIKGISRGKEKTLQMTPEAYGYRQSVFMDSKDLVITEVTLELKPDSLENISRKEEDARKLRLKQPKGPSGGSTFKNPPDHSAGALIDACGLKSRRLGRAQISPQHANFIINLGGASRRDIRGLIDLCRQEVKARFGLDLELEVEFFSQIKSDR